MPNQSLKLFLSLLWLYFKKSILKGMPIEPKIQKKPGFFGFWAQHFFGGLNPVTEMQQDRTDMPSNLLSLEKKS